VPSVLFYVVESTLERWTVTAEVASSSLVVPAIRLKRTFGRFKHQSPTHNSAHNSTNIGVLPYASSKALNLIRYCWAFHRWSSICWPMPQP